jgi:hypothetical protein
VQVDALAELGMVGMPLQAQLGIILLLLNLVATSDLTCTRFDRLDIIMYEGTRSERVVAINRSEERTFPENEA